MKSKVLIAVPTGEFARRADWYDYFTAIKRPEGCLNTTVHGQSPAQSRNMMIEQAIEHECTHIFFLDDDCCPKPDIIEQLLKHDKDIVSGLYLKRNYPFSPLMFDKEYSNGANRHMFLTNGRKGLVEGTNAGLGAVLIKMEVFKALEKPWIRLGQIDKDHWCDDIEFFNRARAAGFKLFIDLDVPVGHFLTGVIWPDMNKETGEWFSVFNTNGLGLVNIPQYIPTDEEIQKDLEKAGMANE